MSSRAPKLIRSFVQASQENRVKELLQLRANVLARIASDAENVSSTSSRYLYIEIPSLSFLTPKIRDPLTSVLADLDAAVPAASSSLDAVKAAEVASYTVSSTKVAPPEHSMLLSPLSEDMQLARDARRGEPDFSSLFRGVTDAKLSDSPPDRTSAGSYSSSSQLNASSRRGTSLRCVWLLLSALRALRYSFFTRRLHRPLSLHSRGASTSSCGSDRLFCSCKSGRARRARSASVSG